MFRYTSIVWNALSDAQTRVANLMSKTLLDDSTKWQVALSVPGIRVYCAGTRPGSSEVYALHNDAGVILGTVFTQVSETGSTPRKANFGPNETAKILATHGRELMDRYWGRYVAFIKDIADGSVLVIRSPSGEIDCFSSDVQGVRVYYSGLHDCPVLASRKFSVNWDHFITDISTIVPDIRQTGLREVERVLRGECIVVQDDRILRNQYWHPFQFLNQPIENPEVASEMLRGTTRACVHAWASCYDRILMMLSGGLDSSILVSSMRDAPSLPEGVCLNLRNPYDAFSDERRYARLAAEHAGYPVVEQEQNASFSLEPLLRIPKSPTPYPNIFEIGNAQQRSEVARAQGVNAYFRGNGGDQIFFTGAARYMCADFLHHHFLHPRIIPTALDAARIRRNAFFPTLLNGIRDGLRMDPLVPALRTYKLSPLLRPEVRASVFEKRLFIPSWFDGNERVTPGKCWQIISLSFGENLQSVCEHEDAPEIVNPLLSQPLQELCLRIPTYVLSLGGRDRGLARHAFKQDLPAEIVNRQHKGGVSEYVKAIWKRNLPFVRNLLLDGILVRERIVDKEKLEKILAGDLSKDLSNSTSNVSSILCGEVWLQKWINIPVRNVA